MADEQHPGGGEGGAGLAEPRGAAAVPWSANGPGGGGTAAAARLQELASFTRTLGTASTEEAFEEAALGGAFALLGADAGSFWRGGAGALTCRLAAGSDAGLIVGKVLPPADVAAVDVRGRAIAVVLDTGDGVLGAMRVSREGEGATAFDAADRAMLDAIGAVTATALAQATRLQGADRSADLALVARLGREIVSTLDLDRVLGIAVNLAARAVPCDRGAIALYEDGVCDVRAVAGTDTVDRADPALQDLAVRGAWGAGIGAEFYLSDRDEPASDAERIFLQVFRDDLVAARVGSALYLPLRDEEGVLGVLLLEAGRMDFADARQRELAAILASQATVAIRNAKLYAQVPLAEALGALNVRRRALLAAPSRRRAVWLAAVVLLLAALTLVRWPLRVAAEMARLQPLEGREARALVSGVVEQVLVDEGARVARGAPLVRLRDGELQARRDAAAAAAEADEREAVMAASTSDAAAERMLRTRAASRRREAALAGEQLRFAVVRAPVDGIVLTVRPDRRVGTRVEPGDAVLLLGRTDSLELEFVVEQREVARVRADQRVRLRVDAIPDRTFEGRVLALGRAPVDSTDAVVRYAARALVPNLDGALRPGMAAHARVLTDPASLATRVVRTPLRAMRLFWWRIWG